MSTDKKTKTNSEPKNQFGKRFSFLEEPEKNYPINDEKIIQLTGRDMFFKSGDMVASNYSQKSTIGKILSEDH